MSLSLSECRKFCIMYGGHQQPHARSKVRCSVVQTDPEAVPCCMSRHASRGSLGIGPQGDLHQQCLCSHLLSTGTSSEGQRPAAQTMETVLSHLHKTGCLCTASSTQIRAECMSW